jgi:hypothetical protein
MSAMKHWTKRGQSVSTNENDRPLLDFRVGAEWLDGFLRVAHEP